MRVTLLVMLAASLVVNILAHKGKNDDPRMHPKSKSKKKKAPKGCTTFTIVRLDDEKRFVDTGNATVIGDSFSYPFYDMDGMKLGYYFDSSTYTQPNEFSDESRDLFQGIFTGSFNFDFNGEEYDSQILVQGIIDSGSGMIAITGGLGAYVCAAGYITIDGDSVLDDDTGDSVGDMLEFVVCDRCS